MVMGFFSVDVRAHRACGYADFTRRSFDFPEKTRIGKALQAPSGFRYAKITDCFGFSEAPFISTSDLTRR
jgi:hypothetical protein